MEDDEKIKLESEIATLKADLDKANATIEDNNTKISELQTYICKHLSSPETKTNAPTEDVKDFATLYADAIAENTKKV